ncbi:hypothetical protein MC885_001979, partial [Smutsia gigantea]
MDLEQTLSRTAETTAIGDTLVQDTCYSPDTQKLLVRLSDTYSSHKQGLEIKDGQECGAPAFILFDKRGLSSKKRACFVEKVVDGMMARAGGSRAETSRLQFWSDGRGPDRSAHTVLSSYWSQQLGKKNMH